MSLLRFAPSILLCLSLSACAPEAPAPDVAPTPEAARAPAEVPAQAPAEVPAEAKAPAPAEDLRAAGRAVAEALRDRDFEALAGRAHPDGVRFSPYSYVDPQAHLTLSPAELRAAGEGEAATRSWGHHDGTGDPIEMTIGEYFDRFVWDAPYLEEGSVALDERQGHGNSMDNAAEVYPDARIVEYHVPGRNPDFGGMDWRSLRLVFEEGEAGVWNLRAVIHDEWTI